MKNEKISIIPAIGLLVLGWSHPVLAQEAEAEVEAEATAEEESDTEPEEAESEPIEVPEEEPEPVEEPEPAAEVAPEPEPEAEPAPAEDEVRAPEEPPEPTGYLDPKFAIGTGLRVGYNVNVDLPDQIMDTNIRPYINGQVSEHIKFEANFDSAFDSDGDATVRLLDAVIKLELHELANFWVGRFLPPTDRANLSGPYFQNSWNYPVQANLFPAIYAGRHDGLAYWGQVGEGVFKWQLGMFGADGTDSNPLAAGRLVLNLLDPEGGYYNSSTYYGTKEILAFGVTAHYQEAGVPGAGIDGAALEGDVLFEKPFGDGRGGTVTAELAYYNFEDVEQGQSFVGNLSYLLPGKQGPGTLQPQARLQYLMPEAGDDVATVDAALNYIVDGHNCRFTLNYQYIAERDGLDAANLVTLGGQIQMF